MSDTQTNGNGSTGNGVAGDGTKGPQSGGVQPMAAQPMGASMFQTSATQVGFDKPCVGCGYNLKGLPIESKCPECGLEIEKSMQGFLLRFASPAYLAKIHKGVFLILAGIIAQLLLGILGFFVGVATAAGGVGGGGGGINLVTTLLAFLGLAVTVVLVVGYWKFTEPDPGYSGIEAPNSARQIARIAVAAGAVVALIHLVLQFAVGAAGGAAAAVGLVALLVSVAGIVAWAVQFFAVMLYLRWLATRVPDGDIVRRTKTYIWLLPVLTTVGIILFGLGPLIALVLYWNLLDKFRKHLKAIRSGGLRAA